MLDKVEIYLYDKRMESAKVQELFIKCEKMIPNTQTLILKTKLESVADSAYPIIACTKLRKPTVTVLLALLLGWCGGDYFYLGDISAGIRQVVLLVLTLGIQIGLPLLILSFPNLSFLLFLIFLGPVLWLIIAIQWLVSLCRAASRAKAKNFNELMRYL